MSILVESAVDRVRVEESLRSVLAKAFGSEVTVY
jgi:hypothetical protein